MDLQHVDVGAEALNAVLDSVKNVLPRQADLVNARPVVARENRGINGAFCLINKLEALGHDDEFGSRDVVVLDGCAENLLRPAVGVGIGHVPCIDALIERVLENWEGFILVQEPGLPVLVAEAHAAEDNLGDFETRFSDPKQRLDTLEARGRMFGDISDVFHW